VGASGRGGFGANVMHGPAKAARPCAVTHAGPEQVRAEVFDSDSAVGGELNRRAVGRRRPAPRIPVLPLSDLRVRLGPDGFAQLRNRQGTGRLQVGIEVHAPMLIAKAMLWQEVAEAMRSAAIVPGVTRHPDQDFRRERLAALLRHSDFGGSLVTLGRALGYESGAFVSQMLKSVRPVSEKTVAQIEKMRGGKFRGWFDRHKLDAPMPPMAALPDDAAAPAVPAQPHLWRSYAMAEIGRWCAEMPDERLRIVFAVASAARFNAEFEAAVRDASPEPSQAHPVDVKQRLSADRQQQHE
jgi:hypothetical protein